MELSSKDILLILFNFFSISLMINAPNIMIGYGLIIPAMMISIIFTRPIKGATLFLISHIIGTIFLIFTSSVFISISILSLILRSLIVFIIAYLYEKRFIKNTLLILTYILIIENILAYSIALIYYGYDAIEVGLDIFSAVYIPYVYLAYKYYKDNKFSYSITLILAMILYYFTSSYFYVSYMNILSILILLYFIRPLRNEVTRKILYILPIVFLALIPLSYTPLVYNFKVILYPYNLSTISGNQWTQTHTSNYCKPGDVFEYVYDPARLRVLDTCVTIEGIVVSNIHEYEDGDICFDVMMDQQYNHMLSIGSIILRKNAIHVEIVPHDQGRVQIPKKGDRVRIIGSWVIDTDHGSYSEIHPAWYIEIIKSNSTS